MPCWSIKKLNQFYETELGSHVKQVIHKDIENILVTKLIQDQVSPSVLTCGYDIMDGEYENTLQPIAMQDTYDCVIGYHCDELNFCMKEFSHFAFDHLKENGLCVLVVSNGWKDKKVPFCKYKTHRMIKALKRLNFKILSKEPILAYPAKLINSYFKNTYPIWNFVCKYTCPSYAGAMLIVAEKHVEAAKPMFPMLHRLLTRADVNHAYKQSNTDKP